ncbi:MAG: hypothetical protein ACI9W1_001307 [Candidatus Azotimanducaceae bacterium]|jgi:hypothetical protein
MATARGLVQRKDTGELVTYRAAALSYEQHCIFSKGDKSLQRKLADKLTAQGVEVHTLDAQTRACGQPHPAGSDVVKAGQPAGHLARTLLDIDSPIREKFSRRKNAKEPREFKWTSMMCWPGQCRDSTDWMLKYVNGR